MFCQYCGKQLSNGARFCNYCGKPVNNAGDQTQQTSAAPAKKGKAGGVIAFFLVIAVFYFGMIFYTEWSKEKRNDESKQQESSVDTFDSDFEQGFKEALSTDSLVDDAMESCYRGAVYEDGYLRYGLAKLHMPGYTLLPGEDETHDWLLSPDGNHVFMAYKQLEIIDVSFDASDEAGILESYTTDYSDAVIEDFRKYEINSYPVIRYIVRYTAEGVNQYQGEVIVFPTETTDETIRMVLGADSAAGYGTEEINKVFDTLQVSAEFMVSAEEVAGVDVTGMNRITVK